MYLHLGQNVVVPTKSVVAVFDMDNTTVSKATRDYLSKMQKDKKIIDVSLDLPKSFVLCKDRDSGENVVYISPISTQTLLKRIQNSKID